MVRIFVRILVNMMLWNLMLKLLVVRKVMVVRVLVVEEERCDDGEEEGDDDGGHVSEDSSWLREVEFIERELEVQSETDNNKCKG